MTDRIDDCIVFVNSADGGVYTSTGDRSFRVCAEALGLIGKSPDIPVAGATTRLVESEQCEWREMTGHLFFVMGVDQDTGFKIADTAFGLNAQGTPERIEEIRGRIHKVLGIG